MRAPFRPALVVGYVNAGLVALPKGACWCLVPLILGTSRRIQEVRHLDDDKPVRLGWIGAGGSKPSGERYRGRQLGSRKASPTGRPRVSIGYIQLVVLCHRSSTELIENQRVPPDHRPEDDVGSLYYLYNPYGGPQ